LLKTCVDIQKLENDKLAPYAMRSGDSLGRKVVEDSPRFRAPFQRDRDRIVHSTAFRRLEYKTQVFVNHEGDHYRTRLTHTLEVAQISRSIARALGLNEDLVETIALSHDLGHPPFGHSGEDALDRLMKDSGGFNHNEQTLRVVDMLEMRYPEFEGLNLSWEIRESIVKHGKLDVSEVPDEFRTEWSPLLEAQLADVADSLAYDSHDIDDGLRSGILTFEGMREVGLWREAEDALVGTTTLVDPKVFTARMVSYLIDQQVRDLLETTHARLEEKRIDSVKAVRSHQGVLVGFSDEMAQKTAELESFLSERLYHHYRTKRMAEKAKRFVITVFEEYRREPLQLPPDFTRRLGSDDTSRVICDYVAGMTDRYCQEEYKLLFQPFERM
jgi:dGTPase